MSFNSKNSVVCFDGFYGPQMGGDCLLAPPANKAQFGVAPRTDAKEQKFLQNLPTINTTMECYISFILNDNVSVFVVLVF